jgi:hypothetical protein
MRETGSEIIFTKRREDGGILTDLRLIRTFDALWETDVFSVLMTTQTHGARTEDFVYDISRDFEEAKRFFDLLCEGKASTVHLRELAEDFLASFEV